MIGSKTTSLIHLISILSLLPASLLATNKVSQNGITWYFDRDYETGVFANGENWVVGPVTITKITPYDRNLGDDIDTNGSMVNPLSGKQGFDSETSKVQYRRELNAARNLPLTLKSGNSIISTETLESASKNRIHNAAVLTVLSEIPKDGSFRPPYMGTVKPIFNKSQLNYSVLRRLKPTANSIHPSNLTNREVKHVLIDVIRGWQTSEVKAKNLTPGYGREIAKAHTAAALSLQLDYDSSKKEPLLIELVQRGIDIYGAAKAGHNWYHDGGHNHGRKIALYIAAKVLQNSDMLKYCDATYFDGFQEDTQHFFVTRKDVDTKRNPITKEAYREEHIGLPEWGSQTTTQPERNSPSWSYTGYRHINGQSNVGLVLVVTLMGDRDLWNSEALFRYTIERYWTRETKNPSNGLNSTNGIPRFTYEMWNKYFKIGSPPPTLNPPTVSKAPGLYHEQILIELQAMESNHKIYYTNDGTDPTTSSLIYTVPINLITNTHIKAFATAEGFEPSETIQAEYTFQTKRPAISPAPGAYDTDLSIQILSTTPDTVTYYTTDGSEPSTNSSIYTNAIELNKTTTLKYFAQSQNIKPSNIETAVFSIRDYSSTESWQSHRFEDMDNTFEISFLSSPSSDNIDAVTGLGYQDTESFSDLACICRYWTDGTLQARNGASYTSDTTIKYNKNSIYEFKFIVNIPQKTYSVTVKTDGSEPMTLARDYKFRLEQSQVELLNTLSHISQPNSFHTIKNLTQKRGSSPNSPEQLLLTAQ